MGRKKKPSELKLPEPSTSIAATVHAQSFHQLPPPDKKIVAILNKRPLIVALAQALSEIEINSRYRRILNKAKIRSLRSLFLYAYNPRGRAKLSEDTGIDVSLLVNWIGQADIFRIPGIGRAYASLLVAAGVDSPVKLGRCSADKLVETLIEVNQTKKIVHRLPTQAQVQKWISDARSLKRIVEY